MVSLSGSLRSETRRCLPSSSSETSTTIFSGMSVGRHSISSSRVTKSSTPPCTLTPTGTPVQLDVHLDLERLVQGDLVEVGVQQAGP